MKQIKTVIVRLNFTGFGGEKNTQKFDEAVNLAIKEISGEIVDIKYAFWQGVATAMVIYEKK
ncbi:MAG: hypothetical protein KGI50_04100 [Patescibacteria group bacterium]|nr:hypothetical protein [Patescibacteria group bacterium]MDE2438871.1 hypothetical protein [Patescibacteria group bacterium]